MILGDKIMRLQNKLFYLTWVLLFAVLVICSGVRQAYATGDNLTGERNIGQAAILGENVTFTTYVPSDDLCSPEGTSYLYAPYYRTGTSYFKSVIGMVANGGTTEVLRKVTLGKGLATTPNIHTGVNDGTKAFVQTSTGAIIGVEQSNPGVTKSGMQSWRELSN